MGTGTKGAAQGGEQVWLARKIFKMREAQARTPTRTRLGRHQCFKLGGERWKEKEVKRGNEVYQG